MKESGSREVDRVKLSSRLPKFPTCYQGIQVTRVSKKDQTLKFTMTKENHSFKSKIFEKRNRERGDYYTKPNKNEKLNSFSIGL